MLAARWRGRVGTDFAAAGKVDALVVAFGFVEESFQRLVVPVQCISEIGQTTNE